MNTDARVFGCHGLRAAGLAAAGGIISNLAQGP